MNPPRPDSIKRAIESLDAGVSEGWLELVADDELTLDEEQIAAYAERSLDEPENSVVERIILSSPRAMELVTALEGELPDLSEPRRQDEPDTSTQDSQPSRVAGNVTPPTQVGTRSVRWPLAVAASVAVIVGTFAAIQSSRLSTVRSSAERDRARLSGELLESQKIRLATLVEKQHPVQFGGQLTPGLLATTLTPNTGFRAPTDWTEDDQSAVDRTVSSIREAAETYLDDGSSPVETISALVNAGRLTEAEQQLTELESLPTTDAGREAVIMNLRGMLLVASTRSMPSIEAQPVLDEAAQRFTEAGESGYTAAFINLSQLRAVEGDAAGRRAALEAYVRAENDPELRRPVERFLEK